MKRLLSLIAALVLLLPAQAAKKQKTQQTDREYWCTLAYKMAQPVLKNMAKANCRRTCRPSSPPPSTTATAR